MKIKIVDRKLNATDKFDIIICVVGYEKRSSHIPILLLNNINNKLAISFNDNQVLSFDSNYTLLKKNGYDILSCNYNEIKVKIAETINAVLLNKNEVSIVIDISSMTRQMIAVLLNWFNNYDKKGLLELVFVYATAKYKKITEDLGPITIAEPVIPEFAGWSIDPDLPPSGIIGLGYEYDRALGIIELLETSPVWAFVPRGEDVRYDRENDKANADLHEIIPESNFIEYLVDNPLECYVRLESLIYGIKRTTRPIIIPFGPKIFSLISMLVAIDHTDEVSVWRVSGDKFATPIDRVPSGKIICLSVRFMDTAASAS